MMAPDKRIDEHPVLAPRAGAAINFSFNSVPYIAREGDVISTAMIANGIDVFNTHHRDGAPQGIFCANGQCAQCLVLVNGQPKKACITPVEEGMDVRSIEGLPDLPADDEMPDFEPVKVVETDILIVGAGPAGMAAATELTAANLRIIIADDKHEPGGKLGLQTHNFFGSVRDCNAGMRGMDIGVLMAEELEGEGGVEVWLNSPAVGVFSDGYVGVLRNDVYVLVKPKHLLITTGAREKTIAFPGCDLPGVYGAGAFQTLVNRDMVKAASRLFIVGGGNVGLIAAYHALQAGIDVLGLVEALPSCGGYKVHLDKIKRLGIPVWTSHTVLKAEGEGKLEKVTIARIDKDFNPLPGTERSFSVDTLLVAVGLAPVDELLKKAREFDLSVYAAGDADVIAEASAAIFSGHITGKQMLRDMGYEVEIPDEWYRILGMLRGKPGPTYEFEVRNPHDSRIYPVIRCIQEIPCNPCTAVCPRDSIRTSDGTMTGIPFMREDCIGCARCVAICPGLAITLVDKGYDDSGKKALVTLPWEMPEGMIEPSRVVKTVDFEGEPVGEGRVVAVRKTDWQDRRTLLQIEVPMDQAEAVAGLRLYPEEMPDQGSLMTTEDEDNTIICRCERVTKGEIVRYIKKHDCTDFNALKAGLRVGMGSCGGKTCTELVIRIFNRVLGRDAEVEPHVERPFTQEVPLLAFIKGGDER